MSVILQEDLYIAYSEVQEANMKIFGEKKKIGQIMFKNAPWSFWKFFLTGIQCQSFCTKIYRNHI